MVVGTIGESEISILNLYAPNEYEQNFYKEIANIIAENAKSNLLSLLLLLSLRLKEADIHN